MLYRVFCVVILCITITSSAFGWWETGHRAVARVAAAHLSPKARTRVAVILGVPDSTQAVADAMAKASTWADEVKASTKTGEWHYIDLTLQDKKTDINERCPKQDCVTARIRLFSQQLAEKVDGPQMDRPRRPAVPDPLCRAMFSNRCMPSRTPIWAETANGSTRPWTPHATCTRSGTAACSRKSQKTTRSWRLIFRATWNNSARAIQKKWAEGDEGDWAWESHELANRVIYQRLHIPLEPEIFPTGCQAAPAEITNFKPVIDTLYIDDMKPVLRDQLSKGGLRLAALLNRTLR